MTARHWHTFQSRFRGGCGKCRGVARAGAAAAPRMSRFEAPRPGQCVLPLRLDQPEPEARQLLLLLLLLLLLIGAVMYSAGP